MLYPEMPKSKKKTSYIVGGIFALLVGLIIFLLFLPSFMDKNFGFKPWDWTTIIPNLNADFFGAVGFYLKLALPIILFLCALSSLFMGLSKSGGMFKGSIMASTLALIFKDSLEPANLTSGAENILAYVEYALIGIALILAILGIVLRFIGDEPYAPHRANSFHFFASFALIVIIAIDVFASVFNISSILSNENYYIGTVFGLFLIISAVWMFCTSTRDQSEFGLGYERDAKIKAEQKTQETAQAQQPPQQTPVAPVMGPNGQQQGPNIPPQAQTQNGQQMPPRPPITPNAPNGQQQGSQTMPPRPPVMGPNGQPIHPRPPMPALGPDGKPLPMPPRPPITPNGQPMPQNPQASQTMPPRPPIAPNGAPNVNTQPQQTNPEKPQGEE